jgi:hypothetical protein
LHFCGGSFWGRKGCEGKIGDDDVEDGVRTGKSPGVSDRNLGREPLVGKSLTNLEQHLGTYVDTDDRRGICHPSRGTDQDRPCAAADIDEGAARTDVDQRHDPLGKVTEQVRPNTTEGRCCPIEDARNISKPFNPR